MLVVWYVFPIYVSHKFRGSGARQLLDYGNFWCNIPYRDKRQCIMVSKYIVYIYLYILLEILTHHCFLVTALIEVLILNFLTSLTEVMLIGSFLYIYIYIYIYLFIYLLFIYLFTFYLFIYLFIYLLVASGRMHESLQDCESIQLIPSD